MDDRRISSSGLEVFVPRDAFIDSRNSTTFLKFIATLLILNSHLDVFYPVRAFGTGGSIGNGLFFMLSAYGLFMSQRAGPLPFDLWFSRRIRKIYPSVWIVIPLFRIPISILRNSAMPHLLDIAKDFLYPPFWFLQGILVYYLLGWPLIKRFSSMKLYCFAAASTAFYLYAYFFLVDPTCWCIEGFPFRLVYYFLTFLLGLYLADQDKSMTSRPRIDAAAAILCLSAIYGHKWIMAQDLLAQWQIMQHAFGLVLLFSLFRLSRTALVERTIMTSRFSPVISHISGLTLQIYIVHTSISPVFHRLKLGFPINIVILLAATYLLSLIVKKLTGLVFAHKAVAMPHTAD